MGSGAAEGDGEPEPSEDALYADLAELAASEWGIHPRDFWDCRPNVSSTPDHELGLTNHLVAQLLDGYMRRRHREAMQLAAVIRASQQEKPQQVEETIKKAVPPPKPAIEYDEWGDQVRNGMVVGFWDQHLYKDTA